MVATGAGGGTGRDVPAVKSLGNVASNFTRAMQDAMVERPAPDQTRAEDVGGDRTLLDKWLFMLSLALDPKMSGGAYKVALVILDSYDRRRRVYECSYGAIARRTALSKRAVQNAVDALLAQGWFLRLSGGRTKGGALAPNRYLPQWSHAAGV